MKCSDRDCSAEAITKGKCKRCYNREYMRTYDNQWLARNGHDHGGGRRTIARAEYAALLALQDGVCAICGKPPGKKRMHVDHCHTTNKIRGVLCTQCNVALGLFKDDVVRMARAIQYLKQA